MTDSFGSFIVTPAAFDVPVANLVPNPSFEVDTSGWTGLTRAGNGVNGGVIQGSWCATALIPINTAADVGVSDNIPVDPAAWYRVALTAVNDDGSTLMDLTLRWYQADGTTLISESSSPGFIVIGTPNLSERSVLSPSGAAFAAVHIAQQSAPFSNTIRLDAVMLTAGTARYDYFDGDTADTAQFTYDWTRTAHNSASIRTAVT